MRIVVDMQAAQTASRKRGIGRYSREFVRALIQNAGPDNEIFLLFNGQLEAGLVSCTHLLRDVITPPQIYCWYAPRHLENSSERALDNKLVAQQIYSELVAALKPDVLLLTSLFEGYHDNGMTDLSPTVLHNTNVACILYDLIPLRHSELFLTETRYRDFYFRKLDLLQRVDQILSISEYTRQDYLALINGQAKNQLVCTIGGGHRVENHSRSGKIPEGFPRKFLLFVGSPDPHKNLSGLLKACARLYSISDLHVVVAGIGQGTNTVRSQARQLGFDPCRIRVIGDCSDSTLDSLYRTCHLFVCPSLLEGFGLPALEAIRAGAVCVASNRGSLPEVVGSSEALFNPQDTDEMALLIQRAWTDDAYRSLISVKQQAHIKTFSWSTVATKALVQMHRLVTDSQQVSDKEIIEIQDASSVAKRIGPVAAALTIDTLHLAEYIQYTFRTSAEHKRIFLDISELTKRDSATGIQRVVRSILSTLPDALPDWQIVPVFASTLKPGYFIESRVSNELFPRLPNDQLADSPALMHSGDILLIVDLQHTVALAQERFLQALRSRGISVYFVIYDILPIQYPYFFHSGQSLSDLHSHWLRLISEMDGYLAISATVRNEVKNWMALNSQPQQPCFYHGYFHLGADISSSIPSEGLEVGYESILKKLSSRPSFLQVSTLEPRKGVSQLLAAFEDLWQEGNDLNLVLVGKRGWLMDELISHIKNHTELGQRLFWLEGVSDEMLDLIYSSCSCNIMASYGEGFGLPLVEAAQKNIPIIARDIPVFREVAGDSAFYFQAESPYELASSIKLWLELKAKGKQPCSSTLRWLSWRESAKMLANELMNAHNQKLSYH